MWKNNDWRQPSPSERAQMLGVPVAAVEAVPGPTDQRRQIITEFTSGKWIPSAIPYGGLVFVASLVGG